MISRLISFLAPHPRILRRGMLKLDERLRVASFTRRALSYLFPDHWSYMLGEIALYSFLILVATGVYLTMFFEPSLAERIYTGSYLPEQGHRLPAAYVSTLELSWDVRAGLLMRQVHHWAANIFIGAIILHMCRNFFTATFRKPRELNWMVGVTLLILAILNGYVGYSLPDDLLSGTGLHIGYSIMLSIPVVGAWLAFFVFGRDFPGNAIAQRLYSAHILIIPVIIGVLIAVHLGMIMRQHHTQFGGPGRSEHNVVGSRMWPTYTFRSLGLLSAVASLLFLLGGLVQINPIWIWGVFKPQTITSPSVSDYYIAWLEGGLRLFPPWEPHFLGHMIPSPFWAGALFPGLTFLVLYLWPWIDRRITGDSEVHHLTARPRESPARVAIGTWAICFYGLLLVAAGQEMIAEIFRAPLGTIRAVLRVVVLVLPVLAAAVAYLIARSLRDSGAPSTMQLQWRQVIRLDGLADGVRPERTEAASTERRRPAS